MVEGTEDVMATTIRENMVRIVGARVVLNADDLPEGCHSPGLTTAQARELGRALIAAACEASLRHGGEDCDCAANVDELRRAAEDATGQVAELEDELDELEDELEDARAARVVTLEVEDSYVRAIVDGEVVATLALAVVGMNP